MVWIYNSPLTEKERKAYDVLNNRFNDPELAKNTVKIISLVGELKSYKFQNAKEIEDSFFFDNDRKVPIFNKQTSEALLKQLKQHGGANTSYPFVNFSAKQGLNKLADVLPEFIVGPIERIYGLLTTPILAVKERLPLVDLSISAANGAAETGITAIGDIAKTIGGPWGTLIAIPIVALASAVAATTAIVQKDLGQAIVFMVAAIPFVGSIMVKGLDKVEKQVSKFKKYPEIAAYIPFIRDHINEERAAKGLPPVEPLNPIAKAREMLEANPVYQQAKQSLNKVSAGIQQAQELRNKVTTGIQNVQNQVNSGIQQAQQLQNQVNTGIQQAQDLRNTGIQQVQNLRNKVSTGVQQAQQLQSQVNTGIQQAKTQVNAGIQQAQDLRNKATATTEQAKNMFKGKLASVKKSSKGGKRFSTRKRNTNKKWLKTRRTKSARV